MIANKDHYFLSFSVWENTAKWQEARLITPYLWKLLWDLWQILFQALFTCHTNYFSLAIRKTSNEFILQKECWNIYLQFFFSVLIPCWLFIFNLFCVLRITPSFLLTFTLSQSFSVSLLLYLFYYQCIFSFEPLYLSVYINLSSFFFLSPLFLSFSIFPLYASVKLSLLLSCP